MLSLRDTTLQAFFISQMAFQAKGISDLLQYAGLRGTLPQAFVSRASILAPLQGRAKILQCCTKLLQGRAKLWQGCAILSEEDFFNKSYIYKIKICICNFFARHRALKSRIEYNCGSGFNNNRKIKGYC